MLHLGAPQRGKFVSGPKAFGGERGVGGRSVGGRSVVSIQEKAKARQSKIAADIKAAVLELEKDPYAVTTIRVAVGDTIEEVTMDPQHGPLSLYEHETLLMNPVKPWDPPLRQPHYPIGPARDCYSRINSNPEEYSFKRWEKMSNTEREILVYQIAVRNRKLKERNEPIAQFAALKSQQDAEAQKTQVISAADAEKLIYERRLARCTKEAERAPIQWKFIDLDIVKNNHERIAPGMLYGLEFPWNAPLLMKFGPEWLTTAFQTAGTLDLDNKITKIILEEKIKITGGNNGGKFLFEVRYAKKTPDLHTKLFAKVPFALTSATMTDRLSSSVYKQPMDLYEINTYRILEAKFPMKTPKFYYGDISNDTSNFILITERVPFAEAGGKRREPLQPYEIEGPYDKCKDWQLKGSVVDYYVLLARVSGRIAGFHRAGKFGSEEMLRSNLGFVDADTAFANKSAWGGSSGDPKRTRSSYDMGLKFIADVAKVLYPDYVTTEAYRKKYYKTMMTLSAYSSAIEYWKHSDTRYIAFGHQNLNTDNAYFWRDDEGHLDCGVFDWGGFMCSCLPHKLWWCLNMADFDQVRENFMRYIDAYIDAYAEAGGPKLDRHVFRAMMILTALQNFVIMVSAVPNNYKMCSQKEWATIKDRHDPRIAGDIDNKSTLRSCIHVLGMGARTIEELGGDTVLEAWVRDVFVSEFKKKALTKQQIYGDAYDGEFDDH